MTKNQEELNVENFDFFKEKKRLFSSLIEVSSKFENIVTKIINLEEKHYYYNLIEVERIEVLTQKNNPSSLFYLIRLNDKNALIISEFDKETYAEEANLCQYFYKIYSKLEPIKEEPKSKILIPSFKINKQNKYMCPNIMPQLTIEKDLENYEISRFFENSEISMDYDLEHDNAVYKNYDPQEVYFIKNNFIFGILNYDILSELNIPTSFITHVNKSHWQEVK